MKSAEASTAAPVRLHLTNVAGLGAVRLLQSLLPSLTTRESHTISVIHLPDRQPLASFVPSRDDIVLRRYKRMLPNALSRFLECTVFGRELDGPTPLLVFGDIPLRCKTRQTVFVQTTLLIKGQDNARKLGALKYWIARWVFRRNNAFAARFIVQSERMKAALIETYPEVKGRVSVVGQPPPGWLISARLVRAGRVRPQGSELGLFYPAAAYPHKNHKLLAAIDAPGEWPIADAILTLPPKQNPNPSVPWIHCVGQLEPEGVMQAYASADALLFLSVSESFGFPLVEAMSVGLPILCPDLPYARDLCGEEAVYFDPYRLESLRAAVVRLKERLDSGWWPDWSSRLRKIPRDWNEVADRMLEIAAGGPPESAQGKS